MKCGIITLDVAHYGCDVTKGKISKIIVLRKYADGFLIDTSLEGSTFYITTGTHGAHVFVGLIALGYLIAKSNKEGYNEEYHDTIELSVYIGTTSIWYGFFVFPFFYLY